MSVKRFDLNHADPYGYREGMVLEETEDGDYMLYSEHENEIEALQHSLATAERERDTAHKAIDRFIFTINAGVEEREIIRADRDRAQAELAELRREVDILRLYGNKDCTAMADEELARIHNPSRGES